MEADGVGARQAGISVEGDSRQKLPWSMFSQIIVAAATSYSLGWSVAEEVLKTWDPRIETRVVW
jgi:hypothetical protein